MKRTISMILAIVSVLTLAACSKAPVEEPLAEQEIVIEQPTDEPSVEPDPAPEQPVAPEGESATYTVMIVEGLVEDAIGYSFEIPVFEYPGYDVIEQFYSSLVESMESFTREVVYTNAMERGCVVSVYGTVKSATIMDNILSVTYEYICDYSDAEAPTIESRIDRFDVETGALVEG